MIIIDTLETTKTELITAGLETDWYSLNHQSKTFYTIESKLGASRSHPMYSIYAIGQIFDLDYPNLVLVAVVVMDEKTGEPCRFEVEFTKEIDTNLSSIFLPIIYRAFNTLDPTGRNRGQVVQRYANARVLPEDFLNAARLTFKLLPYAKSVGQCGTIAYDFTDFLTRIIAGLITPLARRYNIHLFTPTKQISSQVILLRNRAAPDAKPYLLQNTTALDAALTVAYTLLKN